MTILPCRGHHFCLKTKTKQSRGLGTRLIFIFTYHLYKINFEGVISFPSTRENFSFSLRFCFDSGIDKNRPLDCKYGEFKILMISG